MNEDGEMKKEKLIIERKDGVEEMMGNLEGSKQQEGT
jgi:hypothetical protein